MTPEEVHKKVRQYSEEWFKENTDEVIKKKVFEQLDAEFKAIFLAWMGVGYKWGCYEVTDQKQFNGVVMTEIGPFIKDFVKNLKKPVVTPALQVKLEKILQKEFEYSLESQARKMTDFDKLARECIQQQTEIFSAEKLKKSIALLEGN
jgi:hypothetical protein